VVIATVGEEGARTLERPINATAQRRHRVEQRQQLR
jgi:hypothetical protein